MRFKFILIIMIIKFLKNLTKNTIEIFSNIYEQFFAFKIINCEIKKFNFFFFAF